MWLVLALIATLFTSILVIGIKYATTKGIDPTYILFISFTTSAFCALLHMYVRKISLRINWKIAAVLAVCGVFSYMGNLLLVKSVSIAPNPGYTQAILSTNVVLIAVFSYFLFKSELNLKGVVGMVFCIIGVCILAFSTK